MLASAAILGFCGVVIAWIFFYLGYKAGFDDARPKDGFQKLNTRSRLWI